MIQRSTWWVLGVLCVVVAGGGLVYVGNGEGANRAADVINASTEKETVEQGTISTVTSDLRKMSEALTTSILINDKQVFDTQMSDVAQYAYAAESMLTHVTADIRNEHNINAWLAGIHHSSRAWIAQAVEPTNEKVRKAIRTDVDETTLLISALDGLSTPSSESVVSDYGASHQNKISSLQAQLRRVDDQVGRWNTIAPTSIPDDSIKHSAPRSSVDDNIPLSDAIRIVEHAANATDTAGWTGKRMAPKTGGAYYSIHGRLNGHDLSSDVALPSGRIINYHVWRDVSTDRYDYEQASRDATRWLKAQNYSHLCMTASGQYDHIAYFTFHETFQGRSILSTPIVVSIALDNGQIISFHGTSQSIVPQHITKQTMSSKILRLKLAHDFEVREERSVLWQLSGGRYTEATEFLGTLHGQTYSVVLNGATGQVLEFGSLR